MPTYQYYAAQRDRAARRAAHDATLRARHAAFDRQAQDITPKSARPSFAVVGEGTRSAQDNYARGFDQIRWHDAAPTSVLRQGPDPHRGRRVVSSNTEEQA